MNLSEKAQNLLDEIKTAGDEAPVAALKSDFDNQTGWVELVEHNLVNCWADDTETEYVEAGPQQSGGIDMPIVKIVENKA